MNNLEKKEENIYYIFNKGAGGAVIFLDFLDYSRLLYNFFVFQDPKRRGSVSYGFFKNLLANSKPKYSNNFNYNFTLDINFEKYGIELDKCKNKLAEVLSFAVTPQAFYILIKSTSRKNVSLFIKKICTSYSLYFNKKYKRTGVVFESRYKAIVIKNRNILINILHYIHSLPLKLKNGDDIDDFEFLKTYRWSSHLDYCGWNNFPKVINKDFFWDILNGPEKYKENLMLWLSKKEKNENKINKLLSKKPKEI